jgi:hypothetical protein
MIQNELPSGELKAVRLQESSDMRKKILDTLRDLFDIKLLAVLFFVIDSCICIIRKSDY